MDTDDPPAGGPAMWLLIDDRAGNRSQCLGVAEALGLKFEARGLEYTAAGALRRLAPAPRARCVYPACRPDARLFGQGESPTLNIRPVTEQSGRVSDRASPPSWISSGADQVGSDHWASRAKNK